jgi:hypothetical protein
MFFSFTDKYVLACLLIYLFIYLFNLILTCLRIIYLLTYLFIDLLACLRIYKATMFTTTR